MTFGEKLYKLRKEKGLSQEALAEQVSTTRQAVSIVAQLSRQKSKIFIMN